MKRAIVLSGLILAAFAAVYGQTSSEIIVQGNTLQRKFEWLLSNAETGKTYVIVLDRDETLPSGQNLDYDGRTITIILRGRGATRKVGLAASASGSLFLVRYGVTLILENLVTLYGETKDIDADGLVRVGTDGIFIMNEGTAVNGGNTPCSGVEVSGGTFTMNGGTISGNQWGGVYLDNGTFTMNGGTISGNHGPIGGVYVGESGRFAMTGGSISGNRTWNNGGGILLSGTFTMTDGSISGNRCGDSGGGGVCVMKDGIFTMTGGSIFGNIFEDTGDGCGGIVILGGTFNLNSPATKASISGNKDVNHEGTPQVYILQSGIFRVNGLQERGY